MNYKKSRACKGVGIYKNLYLEMNTDNIISQEVKVGEIGGFCVDLAHFKVSQVRGCKEFDYIMERKNKENLFFL